jgi:hypothetical protein
VTHLILHKVRGQPAFDVAEEIDIGDEKGWIIPTSGHRAYPVTAHRLDAIIEHCNIAVDNIPDNWPDHYQTEKAPKSKGLSIFDFIKIPPPKINLRRRI